MSFVFNTVDVKEELVRKLKQDLPAFGYTGKLTVRVIKADPQSPSEIPCIGINRTDDSETAESIADGEGTIYNPDTRELETIHGTFFNEAIEIRIWHTNADERDKLYKIVKAALFAARTDLAAKGLLNITLRGGRDEQDSTMAQAPMVLYWSTITMTYLNPLDVSVTSIVDLITDFTDKGGIADGNV